MDLMNMFEKLIISTIIYGCYHFLVFGYLIEKKWAEDYFNLFGLIGGIILVLEFLWIFK